MSGVTPVYKKDAMEPANVTLVEYYGEQIAPRHYTNDYEILQTNKKTAVYRRGYNFYLAIGLDRNFDEEHDVIRVELKFGPKPKKDKTRITLILRPKQGLPQDPYQWGIRKDKVDPKYVMVEIHIPADAPVGAWSCSVRTNIRGSPKNFRNFQVPDDFYVLFNPWCKEDGVYMENEDERKEYVLNDTGKIWLGTSWNPEGRHWIYGQFDEIALRTSIFLLDKSELVPEERGNPIRVARAISAIINADDDNGLLMANWDGNYLDGISPYLWTGSVPILEQYYNSGGVPVRYGLCWVFSAATVTVCRALGIPCRSTTIYGSAVGTSNITRHYDAFGNPVDDNQTNESLWSFHVWNDVWMSRPLMPEQFGGWQVIDATPQRHSEGMMRCGPASVEAVRQGFTDYLYDTDFVFAKVNAGIRNFVIDEDNEIGEVEISRSNYQPGRKIITKALGATNEARDDYTDITTSYKSQTGIEADVTPRLQKRDKAQNDPPVTDVVCELAMDTVPFGDTLNLVVKAQNKSNSVRSIRYVLQARSVYYTGKTASEIDRKDENLTIGAGQRVRLILSVPASRYLPKLVDQGLIKLYAFVGVDETGQRWAEEDDFVFTKPALTINTGRFYRVGDAMDVNVSFRNPLNIKLTNCVYMIGGPGDSVPKTVSYPDVQPLDDVRISTTITAGWRTGRKRIVATFISKQLPQVSGSVIVNIQPNGSH